MGNAQMHVCILLITQDASAVSTHDHTPHFNEQLKSPPPHPPPPPPPSKHNPAHRAERDGLVLKLLTTLDTSLRRRRIRARDHELGLELGLGFLP